MPCRSILEGVGRGTKGRRSRAIDNVQRGCTAQDPRATASLAHRGIDASFFRAKIRGQTLERYGSFIAARYCKMPQETERGVQVDKLTLLYPQNDRADEDGKEGRTPKITIHSHHSFAPACLHTERGSLLQPWWCCAALVQKAKHASVSAVDMPFQSDLSARPSSVKIKAETRPRLKKCNSCKRHTGQANGTGAV